MSNIRQIFNTVNIGMVILDRDLKVREWNHWMTLQCGIRAEEIVGSSLFEFFPTINTSVFIRNCKAVLTFGNFSFFSQKLHGHLFPFPPNHALESKFEFMQQSCTMGPIRNDSGAIEGLFLIIQDVTELALYEKKLLEMNLRDGLTGIYNRRYIDKRLEREFERSRRYGRELSLIVLDIDHFKKVNDSYGHQCGDLILQRVAATAASCIRSTDCVARYGGEEFCCILPETGLQPALFLAERLRRSIEELETSYEEQTVKVTLSLGVAQLGPQMASQDELFAMADEALFQAKRSGRNRICVGSAPSVGT